MTPGSLNLRCPNCKNALAHTPGSGANCESCSCAFAESDGILDLLGDPDPAVRTELRGLAKENGVDFDVAGPEGVKFLRSVGVETLSGLMDASRGGRVQYYQQTAAAYFEALARSQIDAHLKVAEIGAEGTLWKLRVIEDLCDEAFALNIFFQVGDTVPPGSLAVRVLGDMNDLPFLDASLNLLIYSATLHHSSDLDTALTEASRVLQPGGRAIVVNEPVAGAAKGLGGSMGHDRDEDIHEDEVSFRRWRRAIRNSGLTADHFVPAWFIGQMRNGKNLPPDTRFGRLAEGLAPLARSSALADVLRSTARVPAQAVLGLPLNAVLWKTGER